MKTTNKKIAVLLVLALVFAAPGLTAYLFYQHPQWLGHATTNKGRLLTPPVLFTGLASQSAKWRLVVWNPQHCRSTCLKQVDKVARIRLALGRHLYNVEQWILVSQTAPVFPAAIIAALKDQDIHFTQSAALAQLGSVPQVYIVSPENYIVLAYPFTAKPADIFHDIKQLVTTREKKSS